VPPRDRRELLEPGLLGEADDPEVGLVHAQQERGAGPDGGLVVGGARAVRRPDLDETGTGSREHVGYAEAVADLDQLAAVARRHELPLLDDLGSGVLTSNPLLKGESEPSARESLAAGADLVCFSGDKLLGGPQAGIVVGRAELVERLRRHPLHRAVRADKLTLAALEGTLRVYLDAPERIPVLRMLEEDVDVVRARAERLASLVGASVEETVGRVGGGALPLAELPSFACAVEESLAGPLRVGEPPVVGIVRDGRLLLDCRTLRDDEIDEVAAAVKRCR